MSGSSTQLMLCLPSSLTSLPFLPASLVTTTLGWPALQLTRHTAAAQACSDEMLLPCYCHWLCMQWSIISRALIVLIICVDYMVASIDLMVLLCSVPGAEIPQHCLPGCRSWVITPALLKSLLLQLLRLPARIRVCLSACILQAQLCCLSRNAEDTVLTL